MESKKKFTPIYEPTSDMRTNSLSKVEGGSTVTIIYEGYRVDYTNIKNPIRYLETVFAKTKEEIIGVLINGKPHK